MKSNYDKYWRLRICCWFMGLADDFGVSIDNAFDVKVGFEKII